MLPDRSERLSRWEIFEQALIEAEELEDEPVKEIFGPQELRRETIFSLDNVED